MRTVGLVRRMFDMMCERAVSRFTKGERLADKQLVQEMVADSWVEMEQFRLLTLRTAWKIDKLQDYKQVRADISAAKIAMSGVLKRVDPRGRTWIDWVAAIHSKSEVMGGRYAVKSLRVASIPVLRRDLSADRP